MFQTMLFIAQNTRPSPKKENNEVNLEEMVFILNK
jgi:hypothetical protein